MENKDAASTAIENVYTKLSEKLDKNPESRCTYSQKCVDAVKEGNSAYIRVCYKFNYIMIAST